MYRPLENRLFRQQELLLERLLQVPPLELLQVPLLLEQELPRLELALLRMQPELRQRRDLS